MHFERMAADYAASRPPYPEVLFETLKDRGVIGPRLRVLEVGAGAGLATRALVSSGSEVVAVEPGRDLAAILRKDIPDASVVVARLEDAALSARSFDSAVAATSLHWVDLSIGLPRLHAALRPRGWLAVWRTIFGDDNVTTPFRDRVDRIVARRRADPKAASRRDDRPSMDELVSGGWFKPVETQRWHWSVDLTSDQVRRLFGTFSDWNDHEVQAAATAADEAGGLVTEHYQTVLHILQPT